MHFLSDWFTIFVVGCLAVMSPGPNFFITLRNTLAYSRQAGVYTAVGLAAGDLVHVTYCLVGIGVIISKSLLLFNLLKWLGAAYLVYIGIESLLARKLVSKVIESQSSSTITPLAAVRIGFFTSLLNPKVTLFFLALFTQIIRPQTPLLAQMVYGLTVAGIEFSWFAAVAVAVSQSAIRHRFLLISHWFERVMGAVLVCLGLRLARHTK